MQDKTGRTLSSQEVLEKGVNRAANIWLEFEVMLLRWAGHIPLHHVRRFFYRLSGIKIGRGSTIHMWTTFFDPRNIRIGKDTIVGENALLDGRDKLIIGDHVDIASDVMIYNSEHNIHSEHFADSNSVTMAPIIIEDYVFIGPRVIILPGVTIKRGAVVGAGAVVVRDVAERMIVGGVPAKEIGERKVSDLHYTLGRARWFR